MIQNGKRLTQNWRRKIFFKAAEILSEVWSSTVIDGHPVDCAAVEIGNSFEAPTPDPEWVSRHVLQARYSLQVVKCDDTRCCKPFVSDWPLVFPDRFIPPPAVYQYDSIGVVAVEPEVYFGDPNATQSKFEFASLQKRLILQKTPVAGSEYGRMPFDLYCPKMKDKLSKGICPTCNMYWPSSAAMLRHKKCHSNRFRAVLEEDETEDVEEDEKTEDEEEMPHQDRDEDMAMPVFENIFEKLQSPFEEE